MDIPAIPGSYALTGILWEPVRLSVGRLGHHDFPPGLYIYLGSACGTGGLRSRLLHHLQFAKNPFWHIDLLRPHLSMASIWLAPRSHPNLECRWSQSFGTITNVLVPAPGFGASDCKSGCKSHLYLLPDWLTRDSLASLLEDVAGEPVFDVLQPGEMTLAFA